MVQMSLFSITALAHLSPPTQNLPQLPFLTLAVNKICRAKMERYELVKEIGSGNFGVAKLVRDKGTKELFVVKFIGRGQKIDGHVQREIMNHRSLKHPNIIRFQFAL